jgi:hypothetical protein
MLEMRRQEHSTHGIHCLKRDHDDGFVSNLKVFFLELNSDDEDLEPSSKSSEPSTTSLWLMGRYFSMNGSLIAEGFQRGNIAKVGDNVKQVRDCKQSRNLNCSSASGKRGRAHIKTSRLELKR